jgi:hypothetical protein
MHSGSVGSKGEGARKRTGEISGSNGGEYGDVFWDVAPCSLGELGSITSSAENTVAKWNFLKCYGRVWTGFVWLRIGGRLLSIR